jgi:RNA polymerase sigma-70 factor (ECF subfamily)
MKPADRNAIDRLLWKVALKDDEEAFRSIFLDFFSPLCVFAHRYVENWETCEDLVQDTFFKVWKNRKNMEITISGRNFLLTSVRNACIDHLRRKDTETAWQQSEQQRLSPDVTEDLYSARELETMLNKALARLPENIRTLFEQNRFEGKTYAQIAHEQHISIKTVEAGMTKALKQLRIDLKDFLPLLSLFL